MSEKDALKQEMIALENMMPSLPETESSEIDIPKTFQVTDFQKVIQECDIEALRIVKNVALFYVSLEDIENNFRFQDKIEFDKMELSNLIFQSKSAKSTYVKLLEEIDQGNVHPRIFEVQSSLQKSMMEITKSKTSYQQIMEQSWRNIKQELEIKKSIEAIEVQSSSFEENLNGAVRAMGTRDMIKNLQGIIKSDEKLIIQNENKLNETSTTTETDEV